MFDPPFGIIKKGAAFWTRVLELSTHTPKNYYQDYKMILLTIALEGRNRRNDIVAFQDFKTHSELASSVATLWDFIETQRPLRYVTGNVTEGYYFNVFFYSAEANRNWMIEP